MIATLATNKNPFKKTLTLGVPNLFSFGLMYGRLLVITPSFIREEASHFNSSIKPQTNPIINMGSVSLCTTSDNDLFSMQHT
jgi:hypothetical protein